MSDEEMLDQMFRRAKKFAGAMTLDDIETLLESQQAEIERLQATIKCLLDKEQAFAKARRAMEDKS
jgi:GTP1/Obg family GTP-binding protein